MWNWGLTLLQFLTLFLNSQLKVTFQSEDIKLEHVPLLYSISRETPSASPLSERSPRTS